MNSVFKTFRPEGFSTVNSYLFVNNPDNKEISNCILKIGDTCIMISQASVTINEMRTALYLFVDDVDLVYRMAIENGAKKEFAPMDMDYNDRQAGVIDPSGNYWWISKRLVKKGYDES